MTADIHMRTEATRDHMRQVAELGHQVDQDWKTAKTAITSGEAGIGAGTLAGIFNQNYVQPRDLTEVGVAGMAASIQQLADAGDTCANVYEAADNAGRQALAGGH